MRLTESQLIGLIGRAVRSVLSEGYQDKQPRTQSKEEHDEWVSRKSASKKAYYDSKRKESGEEGDSKDGAIDYYDYKHGKGNFPVMTKESKVRLSASEFQKFITESVKRTINEMSGLPKNYDSRRTAVPNSWNEPDRIDKDDFFDMINSSDEREQKNFVDFVKEYLSDEYENGVSSTVEFLKQVSAGENPFMAAINLGVKWEDIALEFFDIKPVRSYLGDNDQDPRDTIRLSESHLRGIIGESVKRTINEMLTEHETWEPYGSPENEPLEDFEDIPDTDSLEGDELIEMLLDWAKRIRAEKNYAQTNRWLTLYNKIADKVDERSPIYRAYRYIKSMAQFGPYGAHRMTWSIDGNRKNYDMDDNFTGKWRRGPRYDIIVDGDVYYHDVSENEVDELYRLLSLKPWIGNIEVKEI